MSNAKNTDARDAAIKAGEKSNAMTEAIVSGASPEKIASMLNGSVPEQVKSDTKVTVIKGGEGEKDAIIISEGEKDAEVVNEPTVLQKSLMVFKRNRKLFIALAVTTTVAVLIKIAQGVALDDEVDPDEKDDAVADETLEV